MLVVEPSAEVRGALVAHLAAQGHESIGTDSMDAACALVRGPRVQLVLVNLSAFSAASLGALGRALRGRRRVRLLAMVSLVLPGPASTDGGEAPAAPGAAPEGTRHVTHLVRLSGPEQLSLGLRACQPN